MNIIKDIIYGNTENKLDIYLPDTKNFTTIVYFHGGGITGGNKDDGCYVNLSRHFVNYGYAVVNVNYSLYPNAKFPDYLFQCAEAVKYAKDHIKEYGGSGKLVVSGQSAGAWIGAMLMFNNEYFMSVGLTNDDIASWVIESGQMTSHFNVINIEDKLHPLTQRIDEKAPLYYINEQTKFSNALFIYYDNDMAMRKEQNILLFKTIKAFNNDADITMIELPGTHCHGSSFMDEDGEFAYIKESIKYLQAKGL